MGVLNRSQSWLCVVCLAWVCQISKADGSSRCECATGAELRATGAQPPPRYPTDYGVGCSSHDQNLPCEGKSCKDQWCYITDRKTCDLPSRASTIPGWRFSYETCGYLDYWTSEMLFHKLKNSSVNYVHLSNSGGWKGSYCSEDSTCRGVTYHFVENVLDDYAGGKILHGVYHRGMPKEEYEAFFPRAVVDAIYRMHPDKDEFDADEICLLAVGLGYMDICVQAFSMTPARQAISDFIQVYSDPVILVAPFKEQDPSTWENILACMSPFSVDVWLLILAAHIVIALAVVVHERRKDGALEDVPLFQGFGSTLLQFFMVFVGASEIEANLVSGKILKIAFGLLVLFITTTYTANLASLLVVAKSWTPDVKDISGVRKVGVKACVVKKIAEALEVQGILGREHMVIYNQRSQVLQGVREGLCAAAILRKEDYNQAMSEGGFCNLRAVGDAVAIWPLGVPVSRKFHRAMHQGILRSLEDGNWIDASRRYEPEDACGLLGSDDKQTSSMDALDMSGPFLITIALVVCAFLFLFVDRLRSKKQDANPGSDPVESPKEAPEERLVQISEQLSALAAELSRKGKKEDSRECVENVDESSTGKHDDALVPVKSTVSEISM